MNGLLNHIIVLSLLASSLFGLIDSYHFNRNLENTRLQSSCCNSHQETDCCCSNLSEPCGCMQPAEEGNTEEQPAERNHRNSLTPASHSQTENSFYFPGNESSNSLRANAPPDLVCHTQTNLPLLN